MSNEAVRQALHPTPDPSPRRGGELKRVPVSLICLLLALTPTTAFAAEGALISPSVYEFMVFVIAVFVGYYVVWSVTPALHTPLMSVTNAISSVIVVGALLAVGVSLTSSDSSIAKVFGFLALTMASVNIFGGFLVTNRMLAMYKKKDAPAKKDG
ncbi:proton-translocating transhydrogenase family protein [Hyphomicrobium facile]